MRKSLSEKELKFISKLELKQKYFFTTNEIKDYFKTLNELRVYIHRLKKKGRIIKLTKDKFYLIPIKAQNSKWVEYPHIAIDEIMNGKDYCIVGKAAAYYWKLIDQIPKEYLVYTTRKHKIIELFNVRINFRRKRKLPQCIQKTIQNHKFIIATKKEANQWI